MNVLWGWAWVDQSLIQICPCERVPQECLNTGQDGTGPLDSSNPVIFCARVTMSPSSPKMLLVFCDGTGADGTLTSTEAHLHRPPTNVLRLSRAVLQTSGGDNQKRQIVLYMSGVGSESNFHGVPSPPGVALRCVIVPACPNVWIDHATIPFYRAYWYCSGK